MRQTPSFSEIAVIEAITRRLRVDLVLKPVTPGSDKRLISTFLGTSGEEQIVLAVPRTPRGAKVFVPDEWEVGLSFGLGGLWLQARSQVVGRCQFALQPTRRADAILVRRPARILSANRRRVPRHPTNSTRPVAAMAWAADVIAATDSAAPQVGRLMNWSEEGLAIRFFGPPSLNDGDKAIVRLHLSKTEECPILQGVVRHSTSEGNNCWVVGLGDVSDVRPGEAVDLIEMLGAPQA